MPKEIKLPQLGQTMEEGIVVSCLVKVGQKVKKGDFLFEIETDKATVQMESPEEGFVREILVKEGQALSVGDILLILGEENEKIYPVRHSLGEGGTKKIVNKKTTEAPPPEKTPAGKITSADINAAAQDQIGYKLGQKVPLSNLAKMTAEKMLRSKREIPCFYLNITVDATELVVFREKFNKSSNIKTSFNDFIMRALSLGLAQWPIMTGRLEGDSIQLADSINIGLSLLVKGASVTAVVKNADKKNLAQIAQYSAALIERAGAGKLAPADLEGGCITVSNLGAMGIDSFIPIVVPGQCSILGIGKISDTCVIEKDKIVVRKFMKMTLAVDHKVANGAEAAQFLSCVGKLLEDPQKLI
ncbi:MAG: dihydrolipoamide acetyltransferase family protein [Phycisphaerae bacterium]|nr:dihydrolipoamide acetyltransferase family protein [Phycisphaerae bacterium]